MPLKTYIYFTSTYPLETPVPGALTPSSGLRRLIIYAGKKFYMSNKNKSFTNASDPWISIYYTILSALYEITLH